MNEFSSEGPKPWNMYASTDTDTDPSPPETPPKNFGTTTLNAISFCLVATAILVSMFLIMAVFEHLLRPRPSSSSPQDEGEGSSESGRSQDGNHVLNKLGNPQNVSTSYPSGFSVLMPGQHCPTFIAQPAPLPCPREGMYWPSHDYFVSP